MTDLIAIQFNPNLLPSGVATVTAGNEHTCVRLTTKEASCFGFGQLGRLGNDLWYGSSGATATGVLGVDAIKPIQAGEDAEALQVSTGYQHSCALWSSGNMKCWGRNDKGQLAADRTGDMGQGWGTLFMAMINPVRFNVTAEVPVKTFSGGEHSCALFDDNSVRCWGANTCGQLGTDSAGNLGLASGDIESIPAIDLGLAFNDTGVVVQLALGSCHSCALFSHGRIKCWGKAVALGIHSATDIGTGVGTTMTSDVPYLEFSDTVPATHISADLDTTCAVFGSDGRIRCWGGDSGAMGHGRGQDIQWGYGSAWLNNTQYRYLNFSTSEPALEVAVGQTYASDGTEPVACAVFTSGRLRCWGSPNSFQLGTTTSEWLGDNITEIQNLPFVPISHAREIAITPSAIPSGRAVPITIRTDPFIPQDLNGIAIRFQGGTETPATYVDPTTWTSVSHVFSGVHNVTKPVRAGLTGLASFQTGSVFLYQEPDTTWVSPLSGPTTGGTVLTLKGLGYLNDPLLNLKCCFSTDTVPGMYTFAAVYDDNADHITCTTPAVNATALGNSAVNVSVALNGRDCATGGPLFYLYQESTMDWSSARPHLGPTTGSTNVTINATNVYVSDDAVMVWLGDYVSLPATTSVQHSLGPLVLNISTTDVSSNGNVTSGEYLTVYVSLNGQQRIDTGAKWRFYAPPLVLASNPVASTLAGGLLTTMAGTGFHLTPLMLVRLRIGSQERIIPATLDSGGNPVFTPPPLTAAGLGTLDFALNGIQWSGANIVFSYYNLTSISPNAGSVEGNTLVTLHGHGFQFTGPSLQCRFGTVTTTGFFTSSQAVTCVAPRVPSNRTVPVELTVNGVAYTTHGLNYTYYELPTFSHVVPSNAPSTKNSSVVTLYGKNFVDYGISCVLGDGAPRVGSLGVNDTVLLCPVPPMQGVVTLSVAFNGNDYINTGLQVEYFTVVSVSPRLGPMTGGTPILVSGLGFTLQTVYTCRFGNTPVQGTVKNEGLLECIAPVVTSPGPVPLELSADTVAYTDQNVTYLYYTAPTVTQVSPSAGPEDGGTTVLVTGADLHPIDPAAVRCLFGFKLGTVVYSNSSIICVSPSASGRPPLEISLNGGHDYTSSTVPFAFASVQQIIPPRGPLNAGTVVTVNGRQFLKPFFTANQAFCRFGTVTTVAKRVTDSSLTCIAPTATAAHQTAFAITMGGGYTQKAMIYEYYVAPEITSFAPVGGPDSGGTVITIIGTNLHAYPTADLKCKWDAATSSLTILSSTRATCTSPAQIGNVLVSLTLNNQDYHRVGNFDYFSVSGMNPSAGPTSGGTELYISGAGFITTYNATCRIGTLTFPGTVVNSGLITCVTPVRPIRRLLSVSGDPSAALGMGASNTDIIDSISVTEVVSQHVVQVSQDDRTYTVFSGAQAVTAFSYYQTPNGTSFEPDHGSTIGGTTVTVYGRDFVDNGMAACRFGDSALDSPVRATFVNTSTITCVTTPHSIGNVTVYISNNMQQFVPITQGGMKFLYDACGFGTFAKVHTDPCTPCPLGTASNTAGAKQCEQCGSFSYAATLGSTKCSDCPAGTRSSRPGASNITECQCDRGYYHPSGARGQVCLKCPTGAICEGDRALPVTQPGYWKSDTNQFAFIECGDPSACPGGPVSGCGEGYEGRACAECVEGHYQLGAQCKKCPDRAYLLFIAMVLLFIIIAIVLFKSVGTDSAYRYGQTLAIMIDFFQVLQLLGRLPLDWPPVVLDVIRYLTFAFVVDLDLFSPECSLPRVEWIDKWLFAVSLPMAIAVLFIMYYVIALLQGKLCSSRQVHRDPSILVDDEEFTILNNTSAPENGILEGNEEPQGPEESTFARFKAWLLTPPNLTHLGDRMVNAFMFFVSVSYLVVVTATLAFFGCERGPDGVWYLEAQPSLVCFDSYWFRYLPVAIVAAVIYLLVIPGGFVIWVQKNSSLLRDPDFARRYSSMYAEFRTEVPYWGTVIMIEKVILATVEAFTTRYVQFTMMIILLALFVIVVLGYALQPFTEERNNFLEVIVRWCMCLLLLGGLLWHAGNFPQQFARTILLVTFLSIIAFAVVVALYFVAMDIASIRRESKHVMEPTLLNLMRKVLCPNGVETVRQWWQSMEEGDQDHTRFRVLLAHLARYHQDTPARSSDTINSNPARSHVLDNFTSYIFSPMVIPSINKWLSKHALVIAQHDHRRPITAEIQESQQWITDFVEIFSYIAKFEGDSTTRERAKFLPAWLMNPGHDYVGPDRDDDTNGTDDDDDDNADSMHESPRLKDSDSHDISESKKKHRKTVRSENKSGTKEQAIKKGTLRQLARERRRRINPTREEQQVQLARLSHTNPLASALAQAYNFSPFYSELIANKVTLDARRRGYVVGQKDRIIRRLHEAATRTQSHRDEMDDVTRMMSMMLGESGEGDVEAGGPPPPMTRARSTGNMSMAGGMSMAGNVFIPLQALYNSDQDGDSDLDEGTLPYPDSTQSSDSDEQAQFNLFIQEMFGTSAAGSQASSLPALSSDPLKSSTDDMSLDSQDVLAMDSAKVKRKKDVLKVDVPVPPGIRTRTASDDEEEDGLLGISLSSMFSAFTGPEDPTAIPNYWDASSPSPTLVPVQGPEKAAITAVALRTFDASKVGGGADNPDLHHSGINVVRVQRVENRAQWLTYANYRSSLVRQYEGKKLNPVATATHDIAPAGLISRLSPAVNERYLFHGTSSDIVPVLTMHGFDERVSAPPNLFGEGVYFSEHSSKADEYCTPNDEGLCTLILARVTLGVPFISHRGQSHLRRPPCFEGHAGRYVCTHPRFDSLIGDKGEHATLKKYREFVIYRAMASYPEYIITYQRTGDQGGSSTSSSSNSSSSSSSSSGPNRDDKASNDE